MILAVSRHDISEKLKKPTGISHSQIDNCNRCQRRWAYEKILGIKPTEDRSAMIYGDAGHTSLLHSVVHGKSYDEALNIGLGVLKDNYNDIDRDKYGLFCDMLPAHMYGYFTFYYPGFNEKYEVIAELSEKRIEVQLAPGVLWRGYIDLVVRNRKTGDICILDYKFSSATYVNALEKTIVQSRQLANYAYIAAHALVNRWPREVGYVFLKKPKRGQSLKNLTQNPNMYTDRTITLTPQFCNFSMGVIQSDIATGNIMRNWFSLYARHGLKAIDMIPANFSACEKYGSFCGFCQGCHSGKPLHTTMKEM